MNNFSTDEKMLSQIPALKLLIAMGFSFLTPKEVMRERGNRTSNVILEQVLSSQLMKLNRIQTLKGEAHFSAENIRAAVDKLKNVQYNGLLRTNEEVYDLLSLGTTLEQNIDGNSKSYSLQYIDWRNPSRNCFHVAVEMSVSRTRSHELVRPDLVLFVNGIPMGVIECKAPHVAVEQAVSQNIRNQGEDYIPRLFIYSQLLVALNKNAARYATTGTPAKFWGVWKELGMTTEAETSLQNLTNQAPTEEVCQKIAEAFHTKELPFEPNRLVTEQDRCLYALCRPERLLELAWKFLVFDHGVKKIARYQQFFVVKSTMERIKRYGMNGSREGGIIWHTQGSGKSLTMVMLARSMALDPELKNPRIVLVTDRDDLDKQLGNTFAACGLKAERARSGRHLAQLVQGNTCSIITSLVHKFERAYSKTKLRDLSKDIFVLVDESHRTQFGNFATSMRVMFPNACYLGFTGTPLLKKDRNSMKKFGGLIDPHYSITQAVLDGAVVPLLYEGRHVELSQNKAAVDLWFERHTQGLSKEQQADLKRKFARAEMLNKAEQVVYMRAFDISDHYRANWQGTGFKGQLVAPNKATALKYHAFLKELGIVSSAVVISSPDTRENHEEADEKPTDEVQHFWKKMMARYGSEAEYVKHSINEFKFSSEPEILIVVDKLLTGFDAPKNTVLYLCRTLKEHTLLQAIARVNRLAEGKEFGYIVDYANILGNLDEALTMYNAFEGFEGADLEGTLHSIKQEIEQLPTRHGNLWETFKTVRHSQDEEEYERLLADEEMRAQFYARLAAFSKTLAIALSSEDFLMTVEDASLARYKADLRMFHKLKAAVKLRYAEAIDYRDYEPRIIKLLDTHIQADDVTQLNEPVNIFDEQSFMKVKDEQGIKTTASRADTIAHATKKVITEKMLEDPAFYHKFSKLIQEAIDDFRAKRISDLDYLKKVVNIRNKLVGKVHDDVPESLKKDEHAMAYYGVTQSILSQNISEDGFLAEDAPDRPSIEDILAQTALKMSSIIRANFKVDFWNDEDAQNQVINQIEDYLYDVLKGEYHIDLSPEQMDDIIEKVMQVARHRTQGS